jgi:hypothetical protein
MRLAKNGVLWSEVMVDENLDGDRVPVWMLHVGGKRSGGGRPDV